MGCAQVSAASQRHPTAPLPAKRPPCSTRPCWPQDWPLRNARVPCLRREGAKRPAAHHCPPLPTASEGVWVGGRVGRKGDGLVRLECASGEGCDDARAHRSSPEQSPTCRARTEQNKGQHHGPSASFITARS